MPRTRPTRCPAETCWWVTEEPISDGHDGPQKQIRPGGRLRRDGTPGCVAPSCTGGGLRRPVRPVRAAQPAGDTPRLLAVGPHPCPRPTSTPNSASATSVTRREIASFVPPPHRGASTVQLDDLTVTADGRIYVTYRGGRPTANRPTGNPLRVTQVAGPSGSNVTPGGCWAKYATLASSGTDSGWPRHPMWRVDMSSP